MRNNKSPVNAFTEFVVLDRFNRKLIYSGHSIANCAEANVRGTVYGYGPTEAAAKKMANDIIDRCNGKGAA